MSPLGFLIVLLAGWFSATPSWCMQRPPNAAVLAKESGLTLKQLDEFLATQAGPTSMPADMFPTDVGTVRADEDEPISGNALGLLKAQASVARVECVTNATAVEYLHWSLLQDVRMSKISIHDAWAASGCERCRRDTTSIVSWSCAAGFFPRTKKDLKDVKAAKYACNVPDPDVLCRHGCDSCGYDMAEGMEESTWPVWFGKKILNATNFSEEDKEAWRKATEFGWKQTWRLISKQWYSFTADAIIWLLNTPFSPGRDGSLSPYHTFAMVAASVWALLAFGAMPKWAMWMVAVFAMSIAGVYYRRSANKNISSLGIGTLAAKVVFTMSLVFKSETSGLSFFLVLCVMLTAVVMTTTKSDGGFDIQVLAALLYYGSSILSYRWELMLVRPPEVASALITFVFDSAIPLGVPFVSFFWMRAQEAVTIVQLLPVDAWSYLNVPLAFLGLYTMSIAMYMLPRVCAGWAHTAEDKEFPLYRMYKSFAFAFTGYDIVFSAMVDIVRRPDRARTGSDVAIAALKVFDILFAWELAVISLFLFAIVKVSGFDDSRRQYIERTADVRHIVARIEKYAAEGSRTPVSLDDLYRMLLSACTVTAVIGDSIRKSGGLLCDSVGKSLVYTVRHSVSACEAVKLGYRLKIGGQVAQCAIPVPCFDGGTFGDPVVKFECPEPLGGVTPFENLAARNVPDVEYLMIVRPLADDFVFVDDPIFRDDVIEIAAGVSPGDSGSPVFAVMRKSGRVAFAGCISAGTDGLARNLVTPVYWKPGTMVTSAVPPFGAMSTIAEVDSVDVTAGDSMLIDAMYKNMTTLLNAARTPPGEYTEDNRSKVAGAVGALKGQMSMTRVEVQKLKEDVEKNDKHYTMSSFIKAFFKDTPMRHELLKRAG